MYSLVDLPLETSQENKSSKDIHKDKKLIIINDKIMTLQQNHT